MSCIICGHLCCVCNIKAKHKEGCKFLRAATCSTPIECDHGRDVCPICDPCTCQDLFNVPDPHYPPTDNPQRLMIMSNCNGIRRSAEIQFPHTSNPEYEKLKYDPQMEALREYDPHMEALRDRTVKVDVPFLKEWKRQLEEEENARCGGKNEIIVDHIAGKTFHIEGIIQHESHDVAGFEHLHIDADFSLLDSLTSEDIDILAHSNLRTNDGVHCAICLADWNNGEWSPECPSCQDCNYVRNPRPDPDTFLEEVSRLDSSCATVVVEPTPQYEGHPVGTPPPTPTKCTCDIMLLMAQGCKCGFLEVEKFEKERHQDLNSGGW